MTDRDDAFYRLRLVRGFLIEAQQDYESERWRSCVDHAQLAVENAGKAILAIFGPTPRTHEPTKTLIQQNKIAASLQRDLQRILPFFDELGFEEHFKTDYGLESEYVVPWELYDREDAKKAKMAAEKCRNVAEKVFDFYFSESE